MTRLELASRLREVALLRGTFRLRSGTTSDRYFDKYRFESDPVILREVCEQIAPLLTADFDALAGLEMGGIPIATMLAQVTGRSALFVRKAPKNYGTCRYAEGGEVQGRRLLVVEDVVTSGGQILESVLALRSDGATASHVVCVLDRESGGRENLAAAGLTLIALFKASDLSM